MRADEQTDLDSAGAEAPPYLCLCMPFRGLTLDCI